MKTHTEVFVDHNLDLLRGSESVDLGSVGAVGEFGAQKITLNPCF